MDTALILKKKVDSGEIQNFKQASALLHKSEIVKELLTDFEINTLNLVNRLAEIAEIPFTMHLDPVQEWVITLANSSFCEHGFSLNGKRDSILSCYNSMITSVLLRMNYSNNDQIQQGINWIIKYQNVERGIQNKWEGSWILKYGGCMKSTPCFIGVVKAMIALTDYKKYFPNSNNQLVNRKLLSGLEYILNHHLFKRLSDELPITKDIVKLTYPFSYKTNVIEILRLMKENDIDEDPRCNLAKELLFSKKKKDGYWRVNSSYLPKRWVKFDVTGKPGSWISYEIAKLLN